MNRAQLDEIIKLVDDEIRPGGFECVEAEWVGSEGTLRLFVDLIPPEGEDSSSPTAPSGGIDLDGCVAVNRLLEQSETLDTVFPGRYTLEVSSPGLERPLRRAACFRRHVGSKVKVKLSASLPGRKRGTGLLTGVGDGEKPEIEMLTDEGPWSFPIGNLERASLIHEWDSGKPGHR